MGWFLDDSAIVPVLGRRCMDYILGADPRHDLLVV